MATDPPEEVQHWTPKRRLAKKLKRKIGELVLDFDMLKEAAKHRTFPGEISGSGGT